MPSGVLEQESEEPRLSPQFKSLLELRCRSRKSRMERGCLGRGSDMDILLSPIGWVRSSERGPREDFWGEVVSHIVLDRDTFQPDALV